MLLPCDNIIEDFFTMGPRICPFRFDKAELLPPFFETLKIYRRFMHLQ